MYYIRRQKKSKNITMTKLGQQKIHKIIQIPLCNSKTTDPIPGDFVKLVEKYLLEVDKTMKNVEESLI